MVFKNMKAAVKSLREKVAESGTEQWPGPKKAALRTAYQDLLLQGKELYGLGALAKADLDIMEGSVTDPTAWTSVRADNILTQHDGVDDIIERNESTLETQPSQSSNRYRGTADDDQALNARLRKAGVRVKGD